MASRCARSWCCRTGAQVDGMTGEARPLDGTSRIRSNDSGLAAVRLVRPSIFLAKVVGQGLGFERLARAWLRRQEAPLGSAPLREDVRDGPERVIDRRFGRGGRAGLDIGVSGLGQQPLPPAGNQ